MSTAEVAVPDQISAPGGVGYTRTDDPHAENRAKFSPCPSCGANAHEGPEGDHWAQFPHCWRCGWREGGPQSTAPAFVQSLPPGALKQLAEGLRDEVLQALGIKPGERLVTTDEQAKQPAPLTGQEAAPLTGDQTQQMGGSY